MSWMFRWLERLIARAGVSRNASARWVEPSNAITRAVLAGAVADLAAAAAASIAPATVSEGLEADGPEVEETLERTAAQPATRTAQRTRRRRAGRAA